MNNLFFILCIKNFLAFFRTLEQEAYFSKELKMWTCLVYWRQSHNENAAWFLVQRIEINWIIRYTNAGNQILYCICLSVRNGNSVFHTCRHLALAIQNTFACSVFVRNFSSFKKNINHLVYDFFFCCSLQVKIYGVCC